MPLNIPLGTNTQFSPAFHKSLFEQVQRYIPTYGFDCSVRMVAKQHGYTYERIRSIWLTHSPFYIT
jgi:hypothetical protein